MLRECILHAQAQVCAKEYKKELEQARTEAEAAVKQMMQEAEARAAQTTARVLEQAGEECELLKQNARAHLDEAVQLIVERVVNR